MPGAPPPRLCAGAVRLRDANQQDAESFKTRKGKVRGYVDYLTPEQVEYLNQKMCEKLPRLYGYQPSRADRDSS